MIDLIEPLKSTGLKSSSFLEREKNSNFLFEKSAIFSGKKLFKLHHKAPVIKV